MKYIQNLFPLVCLVVLFSVQPQAQVTPPPFVNCSGGGIVYMEAFSGATARPVYHCIDPATLIGKQGPAGPQGAPGAQGAQGIQGPSGTPGQAINSIACPQPPSGSIVYTSFVDANGVPTGSCLPLIVVQSPTALLTIPGKEVVAASWQQIPPPYPPGAEIPIALYPQVHQDIKWTAGRVFQVIAMVPPEQ